MRRASEWEGECALHQCEESEGMVSVHCTSVRGVSGWDGECALHWCEE